MGIYKNVMELLVEEEVVRQFNLLAPRVAAYINQVEWVAHALNQLPPLYATSEKGLHHQVQRGRLKHGAEIKQAVQRAFAAIRRDPLRTSVPLESPQLPLPEILTQLRFLLNNDRLEWESLPYAVEQALQANQDRSIQPAPLRLSSGSRPIQGSSLAKRQSAEPQSPSVKISPRQVKPSRINSVQPTDSRNEAFGWDDPLYNSR
jgi:hypothetical protein